MAGAVRNNRPALFGTTTLLAAAALVGGDAPRRSEQRLFRLLNRGVGVAEAPVWGLMQLGNGLSAVAVPMVLLATGHRRSDAARTAVAAAGGWQLAKAVKRVVRRDRPNALLLDVTLRDGDPAGRGFVSGHATVAMAIATATAPALTPVQRRALYAAAVGVGLARVHVGAHLPLDVAGGAGLGAVWGSVCARAFRTPDTSTPDTSHRSSGRVVPTPGSPRRHVDAASLAATLGVVSS